MKLLGVDYGQKRIGLAFADTVLGMVLPFGAVARRTMAGQVTELVDLIRQEKVGKVVIGFPLAADGHENKNTERVKELAFELRKRVDVPIEFFDERFSTQAAAVSGGTVSRDERAAMIILEGFLTRHPH